jgi:uncharacterized protein (TIGR03437 family)
MHHDDVAGPGNGYVDMFDLNGILLARLVSGGPLNSPWGMTLAPASFGAFGGALLVGNFGDGAINAFDPATGRYLGSLRDVNGAPIHIKGLWGLTFGNGSAAKAAAVPAGGDLNTLYFAAGIAGPDKVEAHGLLGTIQPGPAITPNGVLNAASFASSTAPGAFTAIFGSALAATTRTWTTADFVNDKLPVELDGVSVTIDGKPAYVFFVSPAQIDVIAPADSTSGPVAVVVTNNGVPSASSTVLLQPVSPAFFTSGKYAIAAHADGSPVGPPGVIPGATPAKPGETIAIYGTGFGPTNPAVDGTIVTSPAALAAAPAVMVGDASALVTFSGLSAAGLDQINFTVPPLPAGSTGVVSVSVVAASGTANTQSGLFVAVQSGN